MQNENTFRARKRARGIGKSGTLPIGCHAPKPKRRFKEHNGLSKKERKEQRSIARSNPRQHKSPPMDWTQAALDTFYRGRI